MAHPRRPHRPLDRDTSHTHQDGLAATGSTSGCDWASSSTQGRDALPPYHKRTEVTPAEPLDGHQWLAEKL